MTTTREFELLYHECHVGIERRVGQMMRAHPDEAADIIQSTWYKAWRAWPPTQGASYKWVEKIATNTALDFLRAYKRHQEIMGWLSLDAYAYGPDSDLNPQETTASSPADVSEYVTAQESAEAWLRPLKPHYQQIIALTEAGYKPAEIGARVTNSRGKHMAYYDVKMTLSRARERARKERARQEDMEARALA